ncbi:hypothetical protein ACVWXO_011093 [Bradyrhizobium sp. LM2.7]
MALLELADRSKRPAAASSWTKGGQDGAPSDSIRHVALAGWLIIAVFFGGIGTWALTAPLNGAVVASAGGRQD